MGLESMGNGIPPRRTETTEALGPNSNRRFEVGTEVTADMLEANLGILKGNIEKVSTIPEHVLNSQEGQEQTRSLKEKISTKIEGFTKKILEKLSKLDGITEESLPYVSGVAIAMMIGPALMQYVRSQYPEAGVMLDSAPAIVQQIIHFDALAQIVNLFGDTPISSSFKGGGMEVSNLLADIASGKVDVTLLSERQMELLEGAVGNTADIIKKYTEWGELDVARSVADGSGKASATAKGVFVNMPVFFATAMATIPLANKIGSFANDKLEAMNRKS